MVRARIVASILAVGLGVAGCASDEEEIAADACRLLEERVIGQGPDALMDEDLEDDFRELEQRAEESGLSDEEMERAMRDECPEVFDALEDTFGSPAPAPDDVGEAEDPQD